MNYKLSKWASINKRSARLILILLHGVLILNGIVLAKILSLNGIKLPAIFMYAILILFLVAVFFYPKKNSSEKEVKPSKVFKYSYKRHKYLDIIITISSFLIIVYSANSIYSGEKIFERFSTGTFAADYEPDNSISVKSESDTYSFESDKKDKSDRKIVRKSKRILKKIFKKESAEFNWALFGIIMLIMVVGAAATLGISALACSIMCSGSEVLGWVLLIGGETILILLSIFAIKKFLQKQEAKRMKNDEQDPGLEPESVPEPK